MANIADKFDSAFIEKTIKDFIDNECWTFVHQKLDYTKFNEFVKSAITLKEAPHLNVDSEASQNMNEILSFDLCFKRNEIEVAELKLVGTDCLETFISFVVFYRLLLSNSDNGRSTPFLYPKKIGNL